MIDSLMAASRALYCCTDAYVAAGAVLGSGEAGEEADFLALISSLAGETAPKKRNRALCEFAELGRQLASPSANLRPCREPVVRPRGLIDNHLQREWQRHWAAHLSAAAVRTRPSATSRTTGSITNDFCPSSLLVVSTSTRVRDRVPRVPKSRPNILKFTDFGQATISGRRRRRGAPGQRRELLGSVVYRPSTCFRTEIGCVAAFPCRPAAKPDDLVTLNRADRPIDQGLMVKADMLAGASISQLRGDIQPTQ